MLCIDLFNTNASIVRDLAKAAADAAPEANVLVISNPVSVTEEQYTAPHANYIRRSTPPSPSSPKSTRARASIIPRDFSVSPLLMSLEPPASSAKSRAPTLPMRILLSLVVTLVLPSFLLFPNPAIPTSRARNSMLLSTVSNLVAMKSSKQKMVLALPLYLWPWLELDSPRVC